MGLAASSNPTDRIGSEGSDRDFLPHQESRIKAGLEKAVQHKDKLLEFDKNR